MESKTCVVVDYGLGNTFSVINALKIVGANPILTSDFKIIQNAERVILPGVGAFARGMEKLKISGIDQALLEYVQKERPLLGICLGMQLLMDIGYEFGKNNGLGLISGQVKKIYIKDNEFKVVRVPLIGWYKTLVYNHNLSLNLNKFSEEINGNFYYYVHSYAVKTNNKVNQLAYVKYSNNHITSAICEKNIYGVQFHPERSGKNGLRLISKFINL